MNDLKSMLLEQYKLILSSRSILLDYVKTISSNDFVEDKSSFGNGSIRNLLVHICDCYSAWIGKRALNKTHEFLSYSNFETLEACKAYFEKVDAYVNEFINYYENQYFNELTLRKNGEELKVNPLKLFTHVTTHEFHHKGQIMSLSRHLGYIPVDADIIR